MKLASIEKIADIFPHPNADSLEFVRVLGYNCIVPKNKWKIGDSCVLIQPDTVLPNDSWAEVYKAKSKRVRAIKLRGEYSFGIVETLEINENLEQFRDSEGEEVSQILNIVKYEAPVPQDLSAVGGLPYGICKTDEERFQNLKIEKFLGSRVDITLKVDGQSFTAFYKDGEFGVCGRTMQYKEDVVNNYNINAQNYILKQKLAYYCEQHGVNIALRGEQFGSGIQASSSNPHAKKALGLMFFSCWDIDNKRYFNPDEKHYYRNVCAELNLPMVPLLETNIPLTLEHLSKYQNCENLDGEMFEGVVFVGKNFSFKVINLNYDSKK